MASGYCPYILRGIASIAGSATPQYKINAHGLLQMLVTSGNPDAIKVGNYDGNKRTVNVSYRQRFTKAQTDTSKSCDQLLTPSKLESTVSVGNTRQIAVHLEDGLLELYCNEVAKSMSMPGSSPSASVSTEMADIIFSAANAILEGVNADLSGLVSFGKNVQQNSSAIQTLNIPISSVNQGDLAKGMTMLMSDYGIANFSGRPQVVGSGKMYAYMVQQAWKGMDQSGTNTKISTSLVDFYHDRDFPTGIAGGGGADNIGVFEPGSIQLIQYLQYTGWQAGPKPDGSEFFVLPLPMVDPTNNMVTPVKFDVQLRYFSCPTVLTDAYSGASVTFQKGWSFIISKQFGLWQVYSNAFRAEDPSFQTNGALLYNVTNS